MRASKGTVGAAVDPVFAAHIDAIGQEGLLRLRRAKVLVAGAGGVGSGITVLLSAFGVGTLCVVDPQPVQADNLNRLFTAGHTDLGRLKVDVLRRWCAGRSQTRLIALPSRIQDPSARQVAHSCDLIVCAANTYPARRTVARIAATRGIPSVGAGVEDGRVRRAGIVTVWQPSRRQLACQACLLSSRSRNASAGSLLPTIVALTSALAADAVRLILCGEELPYNFAEVDADHLTFTTLNILRREGCTCCRVPKMPLR